MASRVSYLLRKILEALNEENFIVHNPENRIKLIEAKAEIVRCQLKIKEIYESEVQYLQLEVTRRENKEVCPK